jgi:hypothetical protein
VGYDVKCLHVERNGVGLVVGTDYIVVYDICNNPLDAYKGNCNNSFKLFSIAKK